MFLYKIRFNLFYYYRPYKCNIHTPSYTHYPPPPPVDQPLFHQVILMAGSELCDWAFITENNGRRSLEYAYDLGRMVGCDVEGI